MIFCQHFFALLVLLFSVFFYKNRCIVYCLVLYLLNRIKNLIYLFCLTSTVILLYSWGIILTYIVGKAFKLLTSSFTIQFILNYLILDAVVYHIFILLTWFLFQFFTNYMKLLWKKKFCWHSAIFYRKTKCSFADDWLNWCSTQQLSAPVFTRKFDDDTQESFSSNIMKSNQWVPREKNGKGDCTPT